MGTAGARWSGPCDGRCVEGSDNQGDIEGSVGSARVVSRAYANERASVGSGCQVECDADGRFACVCGFICELLVLRCS